MWYVGCGQSYIIFHPSTTTSNYHNQAASTILGIELEKQGINSRAAISESAWMCLMTLISSEKQWSQHDSSIKPNALEFPLGNSCKSALMSDENSGVESKAAASSTQTVHCFQEFHEASQVQNPVSFRLPQTPTFWSWSWRNCIVCKSLTIWTLGSFSLTTNPTWCSLLLLLLYSAPWSRSSYSSAYVFSFSLRLLVSLLSRSFACSCCCRPASSSLLLLSLHKPAFLHLSSSSTKFPSSPPYRPS